MWPTLYLPKGDMKFEKLDLAGIHLVSLFKDLRAERFTGNLEILSPNQHGLILFTEGQIRNAFYDGTDDLKIARGEVVRYFLLNSRRDRETLVNVGFLDPRVVEALNALEPRNPLYRELESSFLDLPKLFETLTRKRFTGVLRFYHIRSHPRLGNILVKMNKINRDQLQQAVYLQLSRQNALRLGDALVEIGAVKPEDLTSALDVQAHARKGSDIEAALILFSYGLMLGGYTFTHKLFQKELEILMTSVNGADVLLDIIEGGLPESIDVHDILEPTAASKDGGLLDGDHLGASPAKPAPAAPAVSRSSEEETFLMLDEKAENETFRLSDEDLILETPKAEVPEPKPAPARGKAKKVAPKPAPVERPAPPAAAPVAAPEPVPAIPEPEAPTAPAPDTAAVEPLPEELTGLAAVRYEIEMEMGFIGLRLMDRGLRGLGIYPPQEPNPLQLAELKDYLRVTAWGLIGEKRARRLFVRMNTDMKV